MKINDVVTEAGVWDAIKRAAGGVAGATAGYGQAKSQRQGQEEITTLTRDMMPYWQKQVQALKSSDVDMTDVATYQQQFLNWLTTSGFPGRKDFSKALGTLKSTSPVDVNAYLQKAVALHSAGLVSSAPVSAAAAAATPAPTTTAAPSTTKFTSPEQVVQSMLTTLPKEWLPTIAAELLKNLKVSSTPK